LSLYQASQIEEGKPLRLLPVASWAAWGLVVAGGSSILFGSVLGLGPRRCILRSVFGIPCPVCGMSHTVRRFGGGHVLAALSTDPLAVVVLALVASVCALSIRYLLVGVSSLQMTRLWTLRLLLMAGVLLAVRWGCMAFLDWPRLT
jgi:hypothetical protein